MTDFDWKNPDYLPVFRARFNNLRRLEEHPEQIETLKGFYRDHPEEMIEDWGIIYEPRNIEVGLPATVPFILFPKQREYIRWVIERWRAREAGLCEKSRDCGVTWLSIALACTMAVLYEGFSAGFGSRKGEYVDNLKSHKPILQKGRTFLENLPKPLRGNFERWRDAPYMSIRIPDTGSTITGEFGDDIGRGDRQSIFFVDEAAHLERAQLVEASLSATTNCRIDMSSVRGMNNPFAQKRHSGKVNVLVFDWRDDPRKDDAWYEKQCRELDPVVVAQEIDRDYGASMKGLLIPGKWITAAIDAHKKLGIAPSGAKAVAFDVADEGEDKNAVCITHGTEVIETDEWSGKGGDIFSSTEYVFDICDEHGVREFRYDSDGLGAGVRGDARVFNERRKANKAPLIRAVGFRGSGGVHDPEGIVEGTIGIDGDPGRMNKDYFQNCKAQAFWALRSRFKKTHRWVVEGVPCPPDEIISLNPDNPQLRQLENELKQITYRQNELGKIVIEKKPGNMKSPNQADALMIRFAPMESASMEVTGDILRQVAAAARTKR